MTYYGSVDGVAALARVYTENGEWVDPNPDYNIKGSIPTLTQVTDWLTKISSAFDVALAGAGFKVPILTPESVTNTIGLMVEQYTSDLCHAANSSGRFFTDRAVDRGVAPLISIRNDILQWVTDNAADMEAAGAERSGSSPGIDLRTRESFPIFQRAGFGNEFDNWSDL